MALRNLIKSIRDDYNKKKWRGKNVRFLSGVSIDKDCSFEGYNSVGPKTSLFACSVGAGTYLGRNVELASVKIGRFCSLGSYIRNSAGRHPLTTFVSTHPAFFSKKKAAGFTFSNEQKFEEIKYVEYPTLITIGNDVWIGDNVSILDGVKIGDGAVIGANSLVTKDIEPYTINVGVPAKSVRRRFDDETIDFLLKVKWWNRDFEWIRANWQLFSDIETFKKSLNSLHI